MFVFEGRWLVWIGMLFYKYQVNLLSFEIMVCLQSILAYCCCSFHIAWCLPDLTWCIHAGAIRYFRHVHEPANSICFLFLCAFKSTVQYCCYLYGVRSSWVLLARWSLRKWEATYPLFWYSTKYSNILVCWCNPYCRCEEYACHANRSKYKPDGSAEWMSPIGSVRRVAGPAVRGVNIHTVCDDMK